MCICSFLIGDNILAVLKYLATSDMLPKSFEYRHGNVVFFDVLGLFVLAYPARVGTIMNYIIAAIAFLYLGKKVLQPKNKGKCSGVFFFFNLLLLWRVRSTQEIRKSYFLTSLSIIIFLSSFSDLINLRRKF